MGNNSTYFFDRFLAHLHFYYLSEFKKEAKGAPPPIFLFLLLLPVFVSFVPGGYINVFLKN